MVWSKKSNSGVTQGLLSHEPDQPTSPTPKSSVRCRVLTLIALVTLLIIIVVAVEVYQHRSTNDSNDTPTDSSLVGNVNVNDIVQILSIFNSIALNNKNSRSVTRGYNQSAEYVITQLQSTDYIITRDYFTLPVSEELAQPYLAKTGDIHEEYVYGVDYLGMTYSGNGTMVANVTAPTGDPMGCNINDYDLFPQGNIALVLRGVCSFWDKVNLAEKLGASGVIIYNDEARSTVFSGSITAPSDDELVTIPALATSYAVGNELYTQLQDGKILTLLDMRVYMATYVATTYNVIADTINGDPKETVVIGSHLDGVDQGPGINDNGSGSATNLHLALLFSKLQVKPQNRVRFAWWGAEELGLVGSEKYLEKINSTGEINNIALNLNFDMVGSLNYIRGIYNGSVDTTIGSMEITKLFLEYYQNKNLTYILSYLGSGSDHYSFMAYGIPVGGTTTGAGGIKTTSERELFGGEANAPYDSCYHQACDDINNIDVNVLDQMAHGAAYTLEKLYSMTNLHDFLNPKEQRHPTSLLRVSIPQETKIFYKNGPVIGTKIEADEWGRPLKM